MYFIYIYIYIYIYWSWLFHSYYTYQLNSRSMGVHLINERQQETQNLLVKKQIPWSKPIREGWGGRGAMSASRKLQLLESDSIA